MNWIRSLAPFAPEMVRYAALQMRSKRDYLDRTYLLHLYSYEHGNMRAPMRVAACRELQALHIAPLHNDVSQCICFDPMAFTDYYVEGSIGGDELLCVVIDQLRENRAHHPALVKSFVTQYDLLLFNEQPTFFRRGVVEHE